jgi:hypothetical protein
MNNDSTELEENYKKLEALHMDVIKEAWVEFDAATDVGASINCELKPKQRGKGATSKVASISFAGKVGIPGDKVSHGD